MTATAHAPATPAEPAPRRPATAPAPWSAVLAELERDPDISRASFAAWLRGTQLLRVDGNEYLVGAQHSFALEKLERSFRGPIEAALRRVAGPRALLRLAVARDGSPLTRPKDAPAPLPLRPAHVAAAKDPEPPRLTGELRPGASFESFQVGRRNQFAYAAAYAVADNPSFAYNPLVLHGPTGAGKTHLLHAIAQRVLQLRPRARVVIVQGGSLGPDVTGDAPLAKAIRAADVVLIDGLNSEAAADAEAQGGLARLLATLLDADRQVVVSTPDAPKTASWLEEGLRAQLQRGLVAEVGSRDEASAPPAPPLNLIAAQAPGPAPSDQGSVSPAIARRPAAPLAGPAIRHRTGPDQVLAAVSNYYGVPVEHLLAKRRDKETVTPRQVAMYLMREAAGASLSDIGARLGGRDHSTVLHGCERVAELLATDARLRADVDAVRSSLGSDAPGEWPVTHAAAAAAAP